MVFIVEKSVDFTVLSRTNSTTTTTQKQLLTTGLYDWLGGCWSTEGGPVLACTVNAAGAYTVAPTLTFSATGQGSGSRKTTTTGTTSLSGTSLQNAVITDMGLDYVTVPPAPTLSGGTGTGGSFNAPTISKVTGAGTLSCTNGNAAVVGTSTAFTTSVVAGEDIIIGTTLYNILSVTDDTHLTLSTNFGQTTASGLAYAYGGNIVGAWQNLNSLPVISGAGVGPLIRPTGVATQDQQSDIYFYYYISNNLINAVLRYNNSVGSYGECLTCQTSETHGIQFFHFDGNATSTNLYSGGAPSTAYVIGHLYKLTTSAVNAGTNTCTLTATVTDITAGGTIATGTITLDTGSTYPGVSGAGQVGLGNTAAVGAITNLVTYNTQGLILTPSSLVLNQTGVTVNISDAAATWLTNAPNFTATGGNLTITGSSVLTNTTATITVSTGNIAALVTITDTVSDDSGSLNTLAMVSPPAAIATYTINATGATITATTYATEGNANFEYQLYRSPNSNFVYNDGSATLISTQTGVAASTIPTAVTDTTAPFGPNFYQWVTTDSTGQIAYGTQAGAGVYAPTTITFGNFGDSISNGHLATALIQWLDTCGTVTQGSGQTPGTYALTISGGPSGSGGAVGSAVVGSDGFLHYAYISNHGYGYNSETVNIPTATYSGAGGTAGTLSFNEAGSFLYGLGNIGGGYVLAMQKILQEQYGFKNLTFINPSVGGSATEGWMPHGSVLITGATNASPIVISCSSSHGMQNGSQYQFNTVQGNTAANGTYYVNVLNSSQVALYTNSGLSSPVAGNGTYVSGTGTAIGPGSTTGNIGYNLEAAMASWGTPTVCPVVHGMLGANDANATVTQTVYQQQWMAIAYAITQAGYKLVISYPLYWESGTQAKNLLLQEYQTAINNVIAAIPNCSLGVTTGYEMFLNSPELFADGLHLNDAGYGIFGGALAKIVAPLIGLSSGGLVGGISGLPGVSSNPGISFSRAT